MLLRTSCYVHGYWCHTLGQREKGKEDMRVIFGRNKKAMFGLIVFSLFAMLLFLPVSISTRAKTDDFDATSFYKTKCAMCHGPKAEKKFDNTLTDDQLTAAIMSGKKGEKPPNMPEFQSKGVTAEQAKTLVDYMKSLKQ